MIYEEILSAIDYIKTLLDTNKFVDKELAVEEISHLKLEVAMVCEELHCMMVKHVN